MSGASSYPAHSNMRLFYNHSTLLRFPPIYSAADWLYSTNLELNNNEIERYIHLHTFLPAMTATESNTSSVKDYVNVAPQDICSRLKANP